MHNPLKLPIARLQQAVQASQQCALVTDLWSVLQEEAKRGSWSGILTDAAAAIVCHYEQLLQEAAQDAVSFLHKLYLVDACPWPGADKHIYAQDKAQSQISDLTSSVRCIVCAHHHQCFRASLAAEL